LPEKLKLNINGGRRNLDKRALGMGKGQLQEGKNDRPAKGEGNGL